MPTNLLRKRPKPARPFDRADGAPRFVLIAFGRTPISRPGEMRLPGPCNVWAKALDDVTPLKDVASGEKVSVTADGN